jgi:hypothetical protein
MFKKIDNSFLNLELNWESFITDNIFTEYYSKKRGGGSFFYTLPCTNNEFLNLQKKNIFTIEPTFIQYCEFTGPGLVTPHIDRGSTVALNFYLEPQGGKTVFYKTNLSCDINSSFHGDKSKLSYVTDLSTLTEIGSFVANPFDVYLLDVNILHGIEKINELPRTMITFRWFNHTYEEILSSLAL